MATCKIDNNMDTQRQEKNLELLFVQGNRHQPVCQLHHPPLQEYHIPWEQEQEEQ